MEQSTIFDLADDLAALPTKGKRPPSRKPGKPYYKKTHAERFADFDRAHPEVYIEIRRLALQDLENGRKRSSIGYLAEQARRNLTTPARDDEGFMVNNSHRAVVVRKLIAEVPALAPLFVLRDRRVA